MPAGSDGRARGDPRRRGCGRSDPLEWVVKPPAGYKCISLGPDFREWPKAWWGTLDRELDDALKAQSRRLSSVEPLTHHPILR